MVLVAVLMTQVLAPGVISADETAVTEVVSVDKQSLDILWMLIASALVFIMQAGFMCLESGFARAKNSINVAIKNLTDFVVAVAGFWIIGFGLMFGVSSTGWIGGDHFHIGSQNNAWTTVFFVFQAMFCGTAATIFSGAVAERFSFGVYIIISLAISVLIYPVFGHWAWGGLMSGEPTGWLEKKGFIDFAGSTVVHSVGGWISLAGIIVVGPRIGRFDRQGRPRKIQPHSFVLVYLGAFLLFFGWFGFNCGSTGSVTPSIAPIAMNTLLSACFGGIACGLCSMVASGFHRLEADSAVNGVLGGLVGVTAGCHIVDAAGACAIGFGAGLVVYFATVLIENVFKLDDVVGAVPVHGFAGAWGTIATALFMNSASLADGVSRMDQVLIQVQGVACAFAWSFGISYLLLNMINFFKPVRVSPDAESVGLNVAEHGAKSSILELAQAMHEATRSNNYNLSVDVEFGTEIGDLSRSFNGMLKKLQLAKEKEAQDFENHLRQMDEVRGRELAGFDDYLKSHVNSMSQEVHKMQLTLEDLSNQAKQTVSEVRHIFTEVREFEQALSEVATNVSRASKDTMSQMNGMVEKMQEVAAQTNLLAINASVESARAGEAGQGFTVVSNEVRRLALMSAEASKQIAEELQHIQELNNHITAAVSDRTQEIRKLNGIVENIVQKSDNQVGLVSRINQTTQIVVNQIEGAYDAFREKFFPSAANPRIAVKESPRLPNPNRLAPARFSR